jgi:ABC-type uncharacterized transport system substrate-binding protein
MESFDINLKIALRNLKSAMVVGAMLFALSLRAEAQQPTKVPRIGYLSAGSLSSLAGRIEAFRQGLRELGYVEGKNIVIEWREAKGNRDRLRELADELVRLNMNVIVSPGPAVTRPLKEATSTIPIVMAQDTDPVGSGFVASLARPGGNIKGHADAVLMLGNPTMNTHRKQIVDQVVNHRLPAAYTRPEYIDAGGLMYYGTSYNDLYRRAAGYVDRILKGAKPADLPVQQPTKFELIINLKAAKQIGVTIPQSVLYRADKVIK